MRDDLRALGPLLILAVALMMVIILSATFGCSTVKAEEAVCKDEIRRVGVACKNRKETERCRAAIADLNLCLAEAGSDDPIGGL